MNLLKITSLILILILVAGLAFGVFKVYSDIEEGVNSLFTEETTSTTTSPDNSSGEVTSSDLSTDPPRVELSWNNPDKEYDADESDMGLGYVKEENTNIYKFGYLLNCGDRLAGKKFTIEWIVEKGFAYEVDAYFDTRTIDDEVKFIINYDTSYNAGEAMSIISFNDTDSAFHASVSLTFERGTFVFFPLVFEASTLDEVIANCEMLEKYVHVRVYLD